jgi:flagellar secretion chaperone FliS
VPQTQAGGLDDYHKTSEALRLDRITTKLFRKGGFSMYSNGIKSYRKTNVVTAGPKRLILMCYEGAIDSLKLGKKKLAEKDYEAKGSALVKAQDIIRELMNALDFEKGGSVARNLDSLYNYMVRRILYADLHKNTEAIDEVIEMLNTLKSAWEEIFTKHEKELSAEAAVLDNNKREQAPVYGAL